ncbi:MAG: NUDIX domain-containing protein, partial [Gammaproteobacteria bacterium]|nr:NUDIX domain-containing protein [Gammaproteobacteria bacterium]
MAFLKFLPSLFRTHGAVRRPASGAQQAGAIPFMRIQDTCAFLVVTSRHSKRWIFPKGRIDPGEEPWEAALREAYEEAGVRGRISRLPAGFHVPHRPESG